MKIIKILFDDILVDQSECAQIISNACKRGNWTVSGICELSGAVAVVLLPGKDDNTKGVVFAKFAEDDNDGKVAEIHDHYRGGHDLVGTFYIDDQLWGLFKKRN